jgi:coenzyme F420 hydrogenase subunit beta
MKNNHPNISYTVKNNLCCGCGICEGVCPSAAISMEVRKGNFQPAVNAERCKNAAGCHRCYDACPGLGFKPAAESENAFEAGLKEDVLAGRYLKTFVGYSCDEDLRYHAASGGLLTQFLIWLLENGKIDGAVVTRFDKDSALKVRTIIATTRDDLLSAKSSKYSPVTMAGVIQSIKTAPGNRYVIVGLPCHIQGFRKAEKADSVLKKKIIGHFSLYCSSGRSFYFTEYLMKERGIDLDKVDYLAYRDRGNQGGIVVKGENIDYYQPYREYNHPLKSIFVPRRCLLCVDHYGEMADLSFGDINIPPYNEDKVGINSLIVRSSVWLDLLEKAMEANAIELNEVDINDINRSQPSAKMKKGRNVGFIRLLKGMGKRVPEYGIVKAHVSLKYIVQFALNRIQQFIGSHKCLWPAVRFIKR